MEPYAARMVPVQPRVIVGDPYIHRHSVTLNEGKKDTKIWEEDATSGQFKMMAKSSEFKALGARITFKSLIRVSDIWIPNSLV